MVWIGGAQPQLNISQLAGAGYSTGQVPTWNGANFVPGTGGSGGTSAATGLPVSIGVSNFTSSQTLTPSNRGNLLTDQAASAAIILTLPPSGNTIGDTYSFLAWSQSRALKIQQGNASDIIYISNAVSSAGTAHGIVYNVSSRSGPGAMTLTYIATNIWSWIDGYPYDWQAY